MMLHLGRWSGPALGRAKRLLLPLLVAVAVGTGMASAGEVVVTGQSRARPVRASAPAHPPAMIAASIRRSVNALLSDDRSQR